MLGWEEILGCWDAGMLELLGEEMLGWEEMLGCWDAGMLEGMREEAESSL